MPLFETKEILDAFYEEHVGRLKRTNYGDAPNLTLEEKLVRSEKDGPPIPPRDVFAFVVEEVFWASSLTEESRPCRPRLVFVTSFTDLLHPFAHSVPLTRHSLRKLSPAHGPKGSLVWAIENGKPMLTGIMAPLGRVEKPAEPFGLSISSTRTASVDIAWGAERLVAVRAGRIDRLSTSRADIDTALHELVRKTVGGFDTIFLWPTVRQVIANEHGGSLWLLADAARIERLTVAHRLNANPKPISNRLEPEKYHWLHSIGDLAAVDGAVVIDKDLHVLGFGAFVELPRDDINVARVNDTRQIETVPLSSLGGGRHRSGAVFCIECAPAVAIVVSEDQRITLLGCAEPKAPVLVMELGPCGFAERQLT